MGKHLSSLRGKKKERQTNKQHVAFNGWRENVKVAKIKIDSETDGRTNRQVD
jgi:hypothetical protein